AAYFEESLDLDSSRLEAFEKIVRIHTEIRDWGALEKTYQRMLRRLPANGADDLRHALWFQLGLVYRDRMADAERSLEAFRAAAQVRPEDDETRRVVCELFVIVDRIDNAVAATREAIAVRPEEAALYGELATLFLRQKAHDRAFCALEAMAAAGGALTPEQQAFTSSYAATPLKTARSRLPAPLRRRALHPELETTLTAIFACVMPAVIEARRAVVPPQWVTRTLGDSLRPGTPSATRILTSLQRGCDVLGVVRPALYPRKTTTPLSPSPPPPRIFLRLHASH